MKTLILYLLIVTFCLITFGVTVINCQAYTEYIYIGCYSSFSDSSPSSTTQSVSQCSIKCKSEALLFAAMKGGSTCYCGDIANSRVPSSNCDMPCSVDGGTCGGSTYYAVYTGVPTYRGCFQDSSTIRDMTFVGTSISDGRLSMDKCYTICYSSNYGFMGVQNGVSCFCGQQYGKHGPAVTDNLCATQCQGNRSQICGSLNKNSVYSVGYLYGLNKRYSEVFHCLEGGTDMNGRCAFVTCQPGWKGTKCNLRDCSTNNGNCGEQNCEERTVGSQVISECVCKAGYEYHTIFDECTDVDECTWNTCDNSTTICNNTNGSYDCICKPGFVKNTASNFDCQVFQDEDECQYNPCNEPSETCNNTIGSFMCICSPGYNYTYQPDCDTECNKNLYRCKNTNCTKFQDFKCVAPEVINSNEDNRIIILASFLALSIYIILMCTFVIIFYKSRLHDQVAKTSASHED